MSCSLLCFYLISLQIYGKRNNNERLKCRQLILAYTSIIQCDTLYIKQIKCRQFRLKGSNSFLFCLPMYKQGGKTVHNSNKVILGMPSLIVSSESKPISTTAFHLENVKSKCN